ncbi:hypothetical protein COOONC_13382 [Cooperia oncophora]
MSSLVNPSAFELPPVESALDPDEQHDGKPSVTNQAGSPEAISAHELLDGGADSAPLPPPVAPDNDSSLPDSNGEAMEEDEPVTPDPAVPDQPMADLHITTDPVCPLAPSQGSPLTLDLLSAYHDPLFVEPKVEHPLSFSVESIPLPPGSPPPSTPGDVAPAYEFSGAAAPIQDSVIEATPPGSSGQPSSFSFASVVARQAAAAAAERAANAPAAPLPAAPPSRFLARRRNRLTVAPNPSLPDETPPNHAHPSHSSSPVGAVRDTQQ